MSPRVPFPSALALLLSACASASGSARSALPPPAREIRAGTRDPGAGSVPPSSTVSTGPAREQAVRAAIDTARSLVGMRDIAVGGNRFGDDCVALVRAALSGAGVQLPAGATGVGTLHAIARTRGLLRRGAPAAGDVVFLSDHPGGAPAHVGIVETVADDGTALVLHRTGRGVARLRLNAARPWTLRSEQGRLVNDPLVTGSGKMPAGRLFVAWASLY